MRHGLHAAGDDDLGVAGAIACAASITAFRPEPQTLLMVSAATWRRQAGADRGLAGRVLAEAGRDHVAQDHLVHLRPAATPARATASRTTRAPSCGAVKPFKAAQELARWAAARRRG